ncbi:hypothetical protein [Nonomuraea sp. NPDC049129]|uniref:hypothetical protein n=1 Tax=Nonomuraea sp. NPDC049129 TaxID=3155272 RepID=UPI0033FD36A4
MGLDLGLVPELVRHLALPLTAGAFPEAVPDALVREAEALEALADELAAIRVEDAEPVLRYLKGSEWDGAAKDAFQRVLNLLAGDGRTAPQLANLEGDALLKRVEKAIRQEARRLRDHAEDMEHTQWMQYAALALLALAIARLLVWVYLYGPSVLKLIQVRTLMTRMSIQALKWRLLMNMLGFAAVMGGLDLAVQAAQLLFGNRDKLDLESLLLSLGNGALTGLVFTGVDFGLSRLATRELVFIVSRAELGVRDQIAAIGQSVYGRALAGGVSGTVGSIPGLALSDQLDPAHLFYSFVAGTAGGIGIPQSARTHYMPRAGDAPELVHGAEPVAGGRSSGADLSSGTDLSSARHPTGPEHSLTHGQGRGLGGEAAGVRTSDGSEPRRVIEPTQVVLSGERPQAPGGPEQRIRPTDARPAGDAQLTGQVARPALGGRAAPAAVAHGQAGVLGHVSGASNATPGHPQPLHDLPLRTPYVPPTPPPPGPDAQDGLPRQADSQQVADRAAGSQQVADRAVGSQQGDGGAVVPGSDRPAALDQARDPVNTVPNPATHTQDGAPVPREGAPAGAHLADGDGTGRGRIDQLINRDGTPPPPLDPDVTSLGRRIARRLETAVPDEAWAHTFGTMARTVTSTMQNPTAKDMITQLHKLSRTVGMPVAFDGLVRVFDEAQRQGFDPAGATNRLDLVDRLELYRKTDPLLFPGLWLAEGEPVRPSFGLARTLGRIDLAIGSANGTTREIRVNQLRRLTFDLDLGLYSLDHLGRLFLDAEARGMDVQGVAGRHDLVRELERARESDSELWDGLRIADEHAIAGLGDPAARAISRTDRALRSVAPDGRLRNLAAEAGFSHALRTFSEMLVEVDTHGALPERPATHAELVESLTRYRERDMDGWDVRVMDERFPAAGLDPAKAALLGRMDRVIVGDGAPRPPLDPLPGLSRELGLGDRIGRLAHVAERAQRLGFDPVGAPDRAALVAALRGYMDTTPDTWARLRVSDRYATGLGEPATRALARMDRIVGSPGDAPAWVLDPLRKLAGDLGLGHSVHQLAHVFRGAEERGLDPAGAADRADLVHRLNSYYRAPAEVPYRFRPTLTRLAEEALTDQLRQAAARDAAAGASTVRARDRVSDLEAEHARALEARARAWDSRPREPEVSYRWNPEAFERDLAEAFARAERGEPVVPYLTEDATGGLAAPGTGFKFGREIEYDLPESLKPHQDAINQAIARDLYDAGLTPDPWTHPYHTGHDGGYYEGDNGWRLEQDVTVAGELVSPPLYDTPRTWASIQLVCEIIKSHGGVATPSTGGHIHVDTSAFDHIPAFYQRLLRLVNRNYFDTFLRLMTNPEQNRHRGLVYCRPNMWDSAGYVTLDELVSSQLERGSAVNVQSVEGGRTDHTEIRLPDGSLDPGVIQTQIKVALGTVDLALRLGDDQFPLNHDVKDVAGNHTEHRRRLDYSSYLELADHLYHRAADKAQLTALFAITRWNEKREEPWWR